MSLSVVNQNAPSGMGQLALNKTLELITVADGLH